MVMMMMTRIMKKGFCNDEDGNDIDDDDDDDVLPVDGNARATLLSSGAEQYL